MKAAVIYNKGEFPQYTDCAVPVAENDQELLVSVKAVAIKHFDKGRASGTHYSSDAPASTGHVIGSDGVCILEDGSRVFAIGAGGMLAEKAIIRKNQMVYLPQNLDTGLAAALPNAVIGAAMGLRFKADIKIGDTVLINGATGFTGRVAVQIAKHYGAGKIIVTGRNLQSLQELRALGADECIAITETLADFEHAITKAHAQQKIDIVIDYLWGRTAESILKCMKGDGSVTNRVRYVSVGSVTGDLIQLSAAVLRSVQIQLSGSGLGSWTRSEMELLFSSILPEMFSLAAEGKLVAETISVPLTDIASLWDITVPDGRRLVVTV